MTPSVLVTINDASALVSNSIEYTMQLLPMSSVVRHMDAAMTMHSTAKLSWPTTLFTSHNFLHATPNPKPPFIRQPAFALVCLDGSVVLLSEREAHFLLTEQQRLDSGGAAAQPRGFVAHLSFLRSALPLSSAECAAGQKRAREEREDGEVVSDDDAVEDTAPQQLAVHRRVRALSADAQLRAARNVVAAQVFGGESAFQRYGGSFRAQDRARMQLLRSVLLGERSGTAEHVGGCRGAVLELLAQRGREEHFADSCLDEVCSDGALQAMATGDGPWRPRTVRRVEGGRPAAVSGDDDCQIL